MGAAIIMQATEDRQGNITVRPLSDAWAKRFQRRANDNGGSVKLDVYLQGDAAREFVRNSVQPQHKPALRSGYQIRFKMDAWEAGHLYGYDAHTVCEK